MKKLVTLLVFGFITITSFAQQSPVNWTYKAVKENANTYKVIFTATFPAPWHIYSQTTPDGGPVPTSFEFAKNPLLNLQGKTSEKGDMKVTHDKNFGVDVKFYSNKVAFIQTVKVKGNIKTNISGTINFMVCNDHECLPPSDQKFSVALQ
ncbi:protein-disulfide reductase DsbD domain-containing protein [Arachidicoccus soli]|uniref:Sugar transporter n=1 Tax=Arachidicoccus soli TaxID=2341117 RepID=A0A386HP85_9BACT|nr:protein-disulfide reductase DsbD domain-containing protein [Arachidicoccus soli]AYD47459.1 sugar transporter [Arachidicoccus soli]